ncbi:hypothetical protein ACFPRL_18095 [Pseudoclavibacter helvolus]
MACASSGGEPRDEQDQADDGGDHTGDPDVLCGLLEYPERRVEHVDRGDEQRRLGEEREHDLRADPGRDDDEQYREDDREQRPGGVRLSSRDA